MGELWIVDSMTGVSSLLATSEDALPSVFGGVAYNPNSKTIYLAQGWKIYAIKIDATPVRSDSWGAVKAQYRR
jgi:hypothetical protein